jgi:hypothetical protein
MIRAFGAHCHNRTHALQRKPIIRIATQRAADGDLILFTESLDVRFAVRIEEFLPALPPRRFEFGRCNVPVRPAFFGNGAQILAEIFHGGPTEEPIAVVDLITRFRFFMEEFCSRRCSDGRGSSTITWGIMGLWSGSVYSAMSRSFWTIRRVSERKGQWPPTPLRYSFVSVILSVLIVTSRQ